MARYSQLALIASTVPATGHNEGPVGRSGWSILASYVKEYIINIFHSYLSLPFWSSPYFMLVVVFLLCHLHHRTTDSKIFGTERFPFSSILHLYSLNYLGLGITNLKYRERCAAALNLQKPACWTREGEREKGHQTRGKQVVKRDHRTKILE